MKHKRSSSSAESCRARAPSAATVTSGVTGLQGHSSQRFGKARAIDPDYSTSTTISFRLVCADSRPAIEPVPHSPSVIPPPAPVPTFRPPVCRVVAPSVFPSSISPLPDLKKPFPTHWGEAPIAADAIGSVITQLPAGFGLGCAALADWIAQKLASDEAPVHYPRHWGKAPQNAEKRGVWAAKQRSLDDAVREGKSVHRDVICDACGGEDCVPGLVGTRYTLIGSDYDLCEDHFRQLPTNEQQLYQKQDVPKDKPVLVAAEQWSAEIQELKDMGFTDEKLIRRHLWTCDGDVKATIKVLVQLERDARAAEQAQPSFEKETEDMVYMGFEHDKATAALQQFSGDMKAAIKHLMTAERKD